MSCSCIKIKPKVVPLNLPAHFYKADGTVCVDLHSDTKFSKTKSVEELSEFNKIKGSAVLGFSIPMTEKNKQLFLGYGDPSAVDFNNALTILVNVLEGSQVLEQDALQILDIDDAAYEYEAQLINSRTHWKTALEDCRLCELDLGTFELVEEPQNIEDIVPGKYLTVNWINHASYQDEDPLFPGQEHPAYYFPLCHYGNFTERAVRDENGIITLKTALYAEDFRPWVFLLAILRKGFCKVGWNFRSPIFEHQWGRSLICYLLDKRISYTEQGRFYYLKVQISNSQLYYEGNAPTRIYFDNVIANEGDSFNQPDWAYRVGMGVTGACFQSKLNIKVSHNIGDGNVFFTAFLAEIGNVNNPVFSKQYGVGPGQTVEIEIVSEKATIEFFQNYAWYIADVNDGQGFLNARIDLIEATAEFYACDNKFYRGDIIPINETINCDYKFLDLLKGALHLVNGKIKTDWSTRTVWVYPPHNVYPYFNVKAEGFFREQGFPIDISDKVLCNSRKVQFEGQLKPRFLQLAFKDSQDPYINKVLGFTKDSPLWSKFIDFGEGPGFENTTKKDHNPFFEPTAQIFAEELARDAQPVEVPALWDNEDYEISWDIGPRILYAAGYAFQFYQNTNLEIEPRIWRFINNMDFLPFAFQKSDVLIKETGDQIDINAIYGEEAGNDLYTYFYARLLSETIQFFQLEFLVFIDNNFYNWADFRDIYFIYYAGRSFKAKLNKVSDFRSCEALSTPMAFQPYLLEQNC